MRIYAPRFALSSDIDQDRISAGLKDDVIMLSLPKAEKAAPGNIKMNGSSLRAETEAFRQQCLKKCLQRQENLLNVLDIAMIKLTSVPRGSHLES
jgi:hypothetical protein